MASSIVILGHACRPVRLRIGTGMDEGAGGPCRTAAALPARAELFCGPINGDVLDPLGALTLTLSSRLPGTEGILARGCSSAAISALISEYSKIASSTDQSFSRTRPKMFVQRTRSLPRLKHSRNTEAAIGLQTSLQEPQKFSGIMFQSC